MPSRRGYRVYSLHQQQDTSINQWETTLLRDDLYRIDALHVSGDGTTVVFASDSTLNVSYFNKVDGHVSSSSSIRFPKGDKMQMNKDATRIMMRVGPEMIGVCEMRTQYFERNPLSSFGSYYL